MYTVGDFIIRIKNAALAHKEQVVVQYSRLNENVARVLEKGGYISEVSVDDSKKTLTVKLSYVGREPVLNGLQLVSKPGLRVYKKTSQLLKPGSIKRAIVSTPQGIMFADEAREKNMGGEVLAYVW